MTVQHKQLYYRNRLVSVGARDKLEPLTDESVHGVQLINARYLSLALGRIGELFYTQWPDCRMTWLGHSGVSLAV